MEQGSNKHTQYFMLTEGQVNRKLISKDAVGKTEHNYTSSLHFHSQNHNIKSSCERNIST